MPSTAASDLGLQAALAELSNLQQMAALAAVEQEPVVVTEAEAEAPSFEDGIGQVTESGSLRLLRITGEIEAVIDDGHEPDPAAESVQAPFSSAWLPAESRAGIELLSGRCEERLTEGFRKLRERMLEEQSRWAQVGRQLQSVTVASPRRGGGRSVIARNLAACLGAAADARVLLIDADPRRPSLHRRLRVPQAPGLAEAGRSAGIGWREFVRRVPETGLYVLTLGALGAGVDGLEDVQLASLLDRVRADFSWVIIDAPSMETADAEMLARLTDSTLLVLRNEREYFDEAEAAVRRIDSARLLGVILNFA